MSIRGKISLKDKIVTDAIYHLEFVAGKSLENDDYFNSNKAEYLFEEFRFFGGGAKKHFKHIKLETKLAYFKSEENPEGEESSDLREWYYGKVVLSAHVSKFAVKSQNRLFIKKEENYRDNALDLNNVLDLTWNNAWTLSLMSTYWNGDKEKDKEFYPSAQISYKHKHVKTSVFYGDLKGGKVCAGGVCRNLPDFTGAKFMLDFKF